MTSNINLNNISFWLVPAAEDKAFFQETINTLTQQYSAASFTPHVTIYSDQYAENESAEQLIEKATQGIKSFTLKVDKLLYTTNQFTKTLFVQFYPDATLTHISETLRSNSRNIVNFQLNPHLSLIYQYLSEEIKKDLVNSIYLPKSEVFFNEIVAISHSAQTQQQEDVQSWKVIYTKGLD